MVAEKGVTSCKFSQRRGTSRPPGPLWDIFKQKMEEGFC